jgi:hypothetical protein
MENKNFFEIFNLLNVSVNSINVTLFINIIFINIKFNNLKIVTDDLSNDKFNTSNVNPYSTIYVSPNKKYIGIKSSNIYLNGSSIFNILIKTDNITKIILKEYIFVKNIIIKEENNKKTIFKRVLLTT